MAHCSSVNIFAKSKSVRTFALGISRSFLAIGVSLIENWVFYKGREQIPSQVNENCLVFQRRKIDWATLASKEKWCTIKKRGGDFPFVEGATLTGSQISNSQTLQNFPIFCIIVSHLEDVFPLTLMAEHTSPWMDSTLAS